jgi:hypothetical protein
MRRNIADTYYRAGDVETAARLTRASLAAFREARNSDGEAFALCNLAEFEIVRADFVSAAQYVASALDAAQRLAPATRIGRGVARSSSVRRSNLEGRGF